MTFSWKLPDWPATVIAASLPMTCAATIATASGITGLTLPGMIDDPGCSAGSEISANPDCGPEFIQRKSLAIFIRLTARTFRAPENSTAVSWQASASNKFRLEVNGAPLLRAKASQQRCAKRASVLMPVPTAVPPSARLSNRGSQPRRRSRAFSICTRHADSSCAKVSGMASIRCVRPVFTTCVSCDSRAAIAARNASSAGSSCERHCSTALT